LDRVPALAVELVNLKVDVIVTGGPTDTRAAKEATSMLPIVMAQPGPSAALPAATRRQFRCRTRVYPGSGSKNSPQESNKHESGQ